MNFDKMIEPALLLKLEKGLPLSTAEFGRLARQQAEILKETDSLLQNLATSLIKLQEELRELQASVPRPSVDSTAARVDKPTKVQPRAAE